MIKRSSRALGHGDAGLLFAAGSAALKSVLAYEAATMIKPLTFGSQATSSQCVKWVVLGP